MTTLASVSGPDSGAFSVPPLVPSLAQITTDMVRQAEATFEARTVERNRAAQAHVDAAVYSSLGRLSKPVPPPGSLLRASA